VDPDIEVIPELYKPVELLTEEDKEMTEVEIDGNLYIGYISIPSIRMELPVMSDWSYPKLKIAPCRYNGSIRGEDLVLMAHNYKSHFGPISQLKIGDEVFFTDMDGNTTAYEVVGKDVLDPTAVEVMTSGEYDLTLFTCTYGGASRVTVYCDLV
jgi:sortase A